MPTAIDRFNGKSTFRSKYHDSYRENGVHIEVLFEIYKKKLHRDRDRSRWNNEAFTKLPNEYPE